MPKEVGAEPSRSPEDMLGVTEALTAISALRDVTREIGDDYASETGQGKTWYGGRHYTIDMASP